MSATSLGVGPVQAEAAAHGRDGRQRPEPQLAAPDDDLGAGAEHKPVEQVGQGPGVHAVPAAQLGPDLGPGGDVGADRLVGRSQGVAEQRG
ncbi:MAG TPA: hypothetical protein VFZ70_09320, partial [Euzebyales bacterium]